MMSLMFCCLVMDASVWNLYDTRVFGMYLVSSLKPKGANTPGI